MQNTLNQSNVQNLGTIEQQITREESLSLQPIVRKEEDAVFIDENPMEMLKKLQNLKECHFKERLAYAKRLGELLTWIGDDAILSLKIIIQSIFEDSDEIKKCFIGQITSICQLIKQKDNYYELLKTHIVGSLSELLKSNNFDVKEMAGNQISKIANELTENDRGNLILTQVIQMAHDESNDENIIIAIKLFGQLAHVFGQELSESFIALEILSKGEDAKHQIRKEAVLQIANISKALSKEFIKNRILPFYQRKTEERAWQTRKACVDIIVELAEGGEQDNLDFIIQRMLVLLDDQNKWVKMAAYKKLGKFIAILHGTANINDKLLDYYTKMNDNDIKELGIDNEIQIECAFNFPAVLQTYGPKKWPILSKLFAKLISQKDKRIKKPLACSLHIIAKIVGPQIAYSELLKILEQLLQDPNDEIKHGTIENLGKFFDAIDVSKRDTLIDILLIIQKDQKKWRIRELIAKQISHLVQVFDVDVVFQIILPISTKLCNDNIFAVRKAAARQIYELYDKFIKSKNEQYISILKQNIIGFANSEVFNQRQSFVIMCEHLMLYEKFQIDFLEQFVTLGHDRIRNVRISVGKVLQKQIYKHKGMYKDHISIRRLWNVLISDKLIQNSLNKTKYDMLPSDFVEIPSLTLQNSPLKLQSHMKEEQTELEIEPQTEQIESFIEPIKESIPDSQNAQIQVESQKQQQELMEIQTEVTKDPQNKLLEIQKDIQHIEKQSDQIQQQIENQQQYQMEVQTDFTKDQQNQLQEEQNNQSEQSDQIQELIDQKESLKQDELVLTEDNTQQENQISENLLKVAIQIEHQQEDQQQQVEKLEQHEEMIHVNIQDQQKQQQQQQLDLETNIQDPQQNAQNIETEQ